ncbi:RHS repeat domain-containing protein [Propionibacterium acidifaciens]|uniref:RHS repeat domain-containing protein n=1 Tax=Propionibacterium acidifaciens TaxID=556499 RepID=UPI0009DB8BE1
MRTSTRCGSALPWSLIVRGFAVPSLVRFGRDAAGRLVEVTQPTGRSYRYEWASAGAGPRRSAPAGTVARSSMTRIRGSSGGLADRGDAGDGFGQMKGDSGCRIRPGWVTH